MMNTKRISGMLLMCTLLLCSADARADGMVGSWDVVAQSSLGEARALYTFASDGTFTMAGDAPGVRTPGHGVWEDLGDNNVALTFKRLRYDPQTGEFTATLKIRATLVLCQSGNGFDGEFQLDVYNPAGNLVSSIPGTLNGTRIVLERL
jgi:hypothetical protein